MKNITILIICFFFVLKTSAQKIDLKEYNKEKEKILNTIINSLEFDSIYSEKQVYFIANELLSISTPITLKKGELKVIILEDTTLKQMKQGYVCIGDFTSMLKKNPPYVRVQLYSSLTNNNLNLMLEKNKEDWVIVSHLIMEN